MSMFMPREDEMERESSSMYFCFKDDSDIIRLELYGTDNEDVLSMYKKQGYDIKKAIEVSSQDAPKYINIGYRNGKEVKNG